MAADSSFDIVSKIDHQEVDNAVNQTAKEISQRFRDDPKLFADTYAADNVRMNNVLPGWIDSLPATEERRRSVPMGRYGRADEVAATIGFLVSEGAGYITGQNIRVDGGLARST